MIEVLLLAFWYFLPAGLANMTPVLANRIPIVRDWKTPMDLHRHYNSIRLLGDNKTWRGFTTGVVIASLVVLAQHLIAKYIYIDWLSGGNGVDYVNASIL